MMHIEVLRNGAATAPCSEVAACPESLVLREFRLATERDALLARDGTSVESTGEWFCDDCMSIGHGRLDREYDRLTARDLGLGAWG